MRDPDRQDFWQRQARGLFVCLGAAQYEDGTILGRVGRGACAFLFCMVVVFGVAWS